LANRCACNPIRLQQQHKGALPLLPQLSWLFMMPAPRTPRASPTPFFTPCNCPCLDILQLIQAPLSHLCHLVLPDSHGALELHIPHNDWRAHVARACHQQQSWSTESSSSRSIHQMKVLVGHHTRSTCPCERRRGVASSSAVQRTLCCMQTAVGEYTRLS
jgi:hypothetical protein